MSEDKGLDVTKSRKLQPVEVYCTRCKALSEVVSGDITARTHPYEHKSILKYPEVVLKLKCGHVAHIVCKFDILSLKHWLRFYGFLEETRSEVQTVPS